MSIENKESYTGKNKKSYTGLLISSYESNDVNPLLPLLSEEFPDWSIDKIKSYIALVIKNKKDVAGLLVAKNESFYNVGLLIYTIQQIQSKTIKVKNKKNFENCLVIENLVASSPILQKQVFLLMVEEVFKIAKKNSCKLVELPRLDNAYQLVKDKYKKIIQNVNGFRTFLKISAI
jgi:hypothetical protein|tara:strand:- start:1994 stop:2521 length:528 start_codon:yes stop_codon:yes gene_type:complete